VCQKYQLFVQVKETVRALRPNLTLNLKFSLKQSGTPFEVHYVIAI
jgi:hypothetical protein